MGFEIASTPPEPYDVLYKGIQYPGTTINKNRINITRAPSSEGTRYYVESGEWVPGKQFYYDPGRKLEIYLSAYQVRRIRAMKGPLRARWDKLGIYQPWEK